MHLDHGKRVGPQPDVDHRDLIADRERRPVREMPLQQRLAVEHGGPAGVVDVQHDLLRLGQRDEAQRHVKRRIGDAAEEGQQVVGNDDGARVCREVERADVREGEAARHGHLEEQLLGGGAGAVEGRGGDEQLHGVEGEDQLAAHVGGGAVRERGGDAEELLPELVHGVETVSYTHLTLPTN